MRMITKAKKQKRRKAKKRKSEKAKKRKAKKQNKTKQNKTNGRLESRDANPHSINENITIGGRRTSIVRK